VWYPFAKKIKVAGADNVLQGSMPVGDSLAKTVEPYLYKWRVDQLPAHESILKFLRNEFPKFLRQLRMQLQVAPENSSERSMANSAAIREVSSVESFLKNCIRIYQDSPKHQHLIYPFYEELARVVSARREFEPDYTGYFYNPSDRSTDYSWWMADILSSGYNNILNLERLGLYFPPQFKFAIMVGLDAKAKPSLKEDPQRKAMVQYIAEKYPFYRRFLINNGDDTMLQDTILKLVNPTPEFMEEMRASMLPAERAAIDKEGKYSEQAAVKMMSKAIFASSLPTEDQIRYTKLVAHTPTENTENKAIILDQQLMNVDTSKSTRVIDTLLSDVYGSVPEDTFKDLFKNTIFYRISFSNPASSITEEDLGKLKSNPTVAETLQEEWEKCKDSIDSYLHEKLVKLGAAPAEAIAKYVRKYPRAASSIMGIGSMKEKLLEIQKEIEEELEQNRQEREKALQEQQAAQQQALEEKNKQNGAQKERPQRKSVMQELIESGDIEHAPLSRAANGRYLDMALKIGNAMRLDPEIVRRWADIVQVYVIKNDRFSKKLAETKSPNYDTLTDMGFLGAFTPDFSKDENKNKRLPAIFLQEHEVNKQHDDTMVFRALNIPRQLSTDAVMGHEIAHALNYLAMGGEMVRGDVKSGNKARDYLTSYPEIIARVYGELPVWRNALFTQMNNLRERDLVQEAVREEVTENMMTHEAYLAMGGIDPIFEYKRVERNEWPYYHTDNPIAAANKRIERAKRRVMNEILESARERRRDILLDILKKIKYYEEQLKLVAQADSQNGTTPEEANAYREELKKLHQMKINAINGAYDLEIDSSIQSVVTNFVLRNLKGIAQTVSDPDWKPPFTLLDKDGEEIPPAFSPGTEPMSYHEVKMLSDYDNNWSQGHERGMTLNEPKMIEMDFPPKRSGYDQEFQENIEPKYVARMSFNLSRWRRTG
jgi:hypothetical protein